MMKCLTVLCKHKRVDTSIDLSSMENNKTKEDAM